MTKRKYQCIEFLFICILLLLCVSLYKKQEQREMTIFTDLAVVPRENPHPGAAAREPPRDSPVIAERRAFISCMVPYWIAHR